MKSKIITFFSLAILLLHTSCSMDENLYTPALDGFANDSVDVSYLVNGVYSGLCSNGLYKKEAANMGLYGHDVFAVVNANYLEFPLRTVAAADSKLGSLWTGYYKVIKDANLLIDELNKAGDNIKAAYKERIIGEMRFLRAFCYYDLVRTFGEVPIRTDKTTVESDFYLPASSIDDVYRQIFEDLKAAETTCWQASKQPVNEKGRANAGAAKAMVASAALTYANHLEMPNDRTLTADPVKAKEYYKMAYEYADSVITSGEYSLLDDYAALFSVTGEATAYKEVIFAIQFAADTKASSASSRGSEFAYYTQPSTRFNVCGNVTNKKGSPVIKIQPWFYDLCTTGDYGAGTANGIVKNIDYRSQKNFLTMWPFEDTGIIQRITYPRLKAVETAANPGMIIDINSSDLYPYLNKYTDPEGMQSLNNGNDFYIFRLAEMYLIKAEALNEYNDGPTQEAYDALEKVRERARKKSGNIYPLKLEASAGLSKEDFRMKIWDERGLEFLGEPKRHFDAIRMKYKDNQRTMIEYIYDDFYVNMSADLKKDIKYNTSGDSYETGRVYVNCVGKFNRKFLILPIPVSEKETNPNMTQNPDYGW